MKTMNDDHKHVCDDCGREFRNAWGLAVHRRRKHHVPVPGGVSSRLTRPGDEALGQRRKASRAPHIVGFCPSCGLNLEVLQTALSIAGKHS